MHLLFSELIGDHFEFEFKALGGEGSLVEPLCGGEAVVRLVVIPRVV